MTKLDKFIWEHRAHRRACCTVHRFLKGKVKLDEIAKLSLIFGAEYISENLTKTNAVLETFRRKRAA